MTTTWFCCLKVILILQVLSRFSFFSAAEKYNGQVFVAQTIIVHLKVMLHPDSVFCSIKQSPPGRVLQACIVLFHLLYTTSVAVVTSNYVRYIVMVTTFHGKKNKSKKISQITLTLQSTSLLSIQMQGGS